MLDLEVKDISEKTLPIPSKEEQPSGKISVGSDKISNGEVDQNAIPDKLGAAKINDERYDYVNIENKHLNEDEEDIKWYKCPFSAKKQATIFKLSQCQQNNKAEIPVPETDLLDGVYSRADSLVLKDSSIVMVNENNSHNEISLINKDEYPIFKNDSENVYFLPTHQDVVSSIDDRHIVNDRAELDMEPSCNSKILEEADQGKRGNRHIAEPSRVIHLRNVADSTCDSDLIFLALPFGRVSNVLILKGKKQALIEMESIEASKTLINHLSRFDVNMRGRKLAAQYSTHRQIRPSLANPDELTYPKHPASHVILEDKPRTMSDYMNAIPGQQLSTNYCGGHTSNDMIYNRRYKTENILNKRFERNGMQSMENTILMNEMRKEAIMTIDDTNIHYYDNDKRRRRWTEAVLKVTMCKRGGICHDKGLTDGGYYYPVSPDTLKRVFGEFGRVSRIVTHYDTSAGVSSSEKRFRFATVHYGALEDADKTSTVCDWARSARGSLDGCPVYNGYAVLKIDPYNSQSDSDSSFITTYSKSVGGSSAGEEFEEIDDITTKPEITLNEMDKDGRTANIMIDKSQAKVIVTGSLDRKAKKPINQNMNKKYTGNHRVREVYNFEMGENIDRALANEEAEEDYADFNIGENSKQCHYRSTKFENVSRFNPFRQPEMSEFSNRPKFDTKMAADQSSGDNGKRYNHDDYVNPGTVNKNLRCGGTTIRPVTTVKVNDTVHYLDTLSNYYPSFPPYVDEYYQDENLYHQQHSSYTPKLDDSCLKPMLASEPRYHTSSPHNNEEYETGSPVLLVSNLGPELTIPRRLFNLFGAFGDVQRVKVLFNKRDAALVQMRSGAAAQTALRHLDKVTAFGRVMRITPSIFVQVEGPSTAAELSRSLSRGTDTYTGGILTRDKS
ncbi:unnamed protein product [Gordionus sp. m RMFG-2023]